MSLLEFREEQLRDELWTLRGAPVWILSGQIGIVVGVLIGFSAIPDFKPNVFILMLFMCIAGMVVFSPAGRISATKIYWLPIVITLWMIFSALWTYNIFGWRRDAELLFPTLLGVMFIFAFLPVDDVWRGIVAACHTTIGYTVFYTITNPGVAMNHPDGTPGWTGGFGHKNGLAPFMVLAIIFLVHQERVPWRRNLSVTVAVLFALVSQSTTMLAIGIILIPLGVLVHRAAKLDATGRAALLAVAVNGVLFMTLLLTLVIEQVLAARGKDLTFSRRTEIWAGVWDAIEIEPWLGYGLGGVWINPAYPPTNNILRPLGFPVFHSHNGYLEVWLQFGIIGLVLILAMLFMLLRSGVRLLRRDVDRGTVTILYVTLIALTSLSEVLFLGMWLAMAMGLYVLTNRERDLHDRGGGVERSASAAGSRWS